MLEIIYTEEKKNDSYNLLLSMKTQYDKQANAFYIKFSAEKASVAKTVKLNNFLLVDMDKGKNIWD